ncbi:MAG: HD domain-containing protein [Christensenellales bacterium]
MARFDDVKARALSFLLDKNPDYAPVGIAHLGYAACLCALIARARGLDMELAQTAGYLHDLWLHWHHPYDAETARRHASEGAILAEGMLRETRAYTDDEIYTVRRMIENHDFTDQTHDGMSEVMKDADMLSHYLNASAAGRECEFHPRAAKVLAELNADLDISAPRGV